MQNNTLPSKRVWLKVKPFIDDQRLMQDDYQWWFHIAIRYTPYTTVEFSWTRLIQTWYARERYTDNSDFQWLVQRAFEDGWNHYKELVYEIRSQI